MKKTVILVSVILCLFCMISCSTEIWTSVEIAGYGSIKIPQDWTYELVDDFMYFSSEENGCSKNVLSQYRDDISINEHFSEIKDLVWLEDENFSNSASITKYQVYYMDGVSEEIFALCFTGSSDYKSTEFFCLDNSVSESLLKK